MTLEEIVLKVMNSSCWASVLDITNQAEAFESFSSIKPITVGEVAKAIDSLIGRKLVSENPEDGKFFLLTDKGVEERKKIKK